MANWLFLAKILRFFICAIFTLPLEAKEKMCPRSFLCNSDIMYMYILIKALKIICNAWLYVKAGVKNGKFAIFVKFTFFLGRPLLASRNLKNQVYVGFKNYFS